MHSVRKPSWLAAVALTVLAGYAAPARAQIMIPPPYVAPGPAVTYAPRVYTRAPVYYRRAGRAYYAPRGTYRAYGGAPSQGYYPARRGLRLYKPWLNNRW
jgi:hypothetical protein